HVRSWKPSRSSAQERSARLACLKACDTSRSLGGKSVIDRLKVSKLSPPHAPVLLPLPLMKSAISVAVVENSLSVLASVRVSTGLPGQGSQPILGRSRVGATA